MSESRPLPAPGHMGVDYEERVDFARLRDYRLRRAKAALESSECGAFLLFDPVTKKAWLYAFNLPALPNGKVYQLWAIEDKPVSAGVFGLDTGQKGRMMIRNLHQFSRMKKFAVTMEPDGGLAQPTGAIYLVGQI